jgi:uncharacterized membrane protein YbhN (UPF0104 family)
MERSPLTAPQLTPHDTDEPPVRWWHTRWFRGAVSLAVVAVIFGFFFPRLADYGAVWDTVTAMNGRELITLGAVALVSLVSYWPLQVAAQPGLHLREAAVGNLASTAVANTVPGGAALGIGLTVTMQRSWGLRVTDTALAIVVTGVWNNFIKLGMPVLALALLAINGEGGTALAAAAFVGAAVLVAAIGIFALLLRSEQMAMRLGVIGGRVITGLLALVHRSVAVDWPGRTARFRARVIGLLRARWIWITVAALVSHLSLFLVLLVALRNVGVTDEEVSWQAVLAAFAFVRLVSAVPVTPGGLGLVELGLTAALGAGLPEQARNQVAAAVLLFRALTWLLPIPLGVGCWLFWRTNRSWRQSPEDRDERRNARHAATPDAEPVVR